MDLTTGAGAFATIIGLLCNFKSQHSSKDLNDFISWLKQKQHDDVVLSLQNNQLLLQQLSSLLSENHGKLLNRLNDLDVLISSVASHIKEFAGLARTLHPQLSISDQAVSILRQFASSGAKLFIERKFMNGHPNEYSLLDGGLGKLSYDEPRFIEDDLDTLVRMGLLRMDFASKGSRRFHVTRSAVNFIKQIDQ